MEDLIVISILTKLFYHLFIELQEWFTQKDSTQLKYFTLLLEVMAIGLLSPFVSRSIHNIDFYKFCVNILFNLPSILMSKYYSINTR